MPGKKVKPAGLTKDAGFQVGARRTFPISSDEAWVVLFSHLCTRIWLGENDVEEWEKGLIFGTHEGGRGEVRVCRLLSHIRLTWQPPGWENASILQVRVIPKGDKTTVSFHQERLKDPEQRTLMKEHWQAVLAQLAVIFEKWEAK